MEGFRRRFEHVKEIERRDLPLSLLSAPLELGGDWKFAPPPAVTPASYCGCANYIFPS